MTNMETATNWGKYETKIFKLISYVLQVVQKVSVHLTITVQYTIDELKMSITEYILNVDRAILNTVFENTVRRVNKCLENWRGTLWTLLVTFCIVIIRCTETLYHSVFKYIPKYIQDVRELIQLPCHRNQLPIRNQTPDLRHHHHQSFMQLGHLLTRSGLTHPQVSLTVYHDFFCQLGNIVS